MSEPTLEELDRWGHIVERLRGTCDMLEDGLEDEDAEDLQDHLPFLDYLDNHIFRCECCGWWCEISESVDSDDYDLVCGDCVPDEED